MLLLLDIGNTHTHAGLARGKSILQPINFPTSDWSNGRMPRQVARYLRGKRLTSVAMCSVVPAATTKAVLTFKRIWKLPPFQLSHRTVRGLGVDYPRPGSIGADRLANAVAARHLFGTPVVVVDFGTAVTFDVVNRRGDYVGGIIAPGLEVMTNYLHAKTALLPQIKIREVTGSIGKSTEQAMLIGAVHGYRGLVRELIANLKKELKSPRLPVIATGGYARLMAKGLPEISAIDPLLTLKGLRLAWQLNHADS